jgi:trans-2,3-dihydro-3-hydroxyanthranilate isomerase
MGEHSMTTRRDFLQLGASAATVAGTTVAVGAVDPANSVRRFHFVQIDVFSSQRLQGNPLAVFPNAHGLTDAEMQDIARETNLHETTFVLPRDPTVERAQGVQVRIFVPDREIPFGGHPTLGTAMVIRNRILAANTPVTPPQQIVLDLKVGRIPVVFTKDASGHVFGEMHQVEPVFGQIHDRETVAGLVGIKSTDISDDGPIQTVSTGLPRAIVPLKELRTLQALRPDLQRVQAYFQHESELTSFYYITRDTHDPVIGLRSRAIYANGEDPATGSAAGCTAAWMVRYGLTKSGQMIHIEQGVEMRRPSHIFARAEKQGDKVLNVRVGGNAVEIAEGEFSL